MKVENIIENSFRLWKSNLKIGILFFFGFALLISILFVGMYSILKWELIPVAKNFVHLFDLMFILKVIVSFYALVLISIFLSDFFFLSGVCGCGSILKAKKFSFRNSIKCAYSKYLTFLGVTFVMWVIYTTLNFASHILSNLNSFSPLKTVLGIVGIVLGFMFIYAPYAVVEGYGVFGSLRISFECVKKEPVKTLISAIFCFVVAFIVVLLIVGIIFSVVVFTIFSYRNFTILIVVYYIFALIMSVGLAYAQYLVSIVLYATFLDVLEINHVNFNLN